ncbi:MAG: DNA-binding protein [Deltaproteobacteria bacterium]|nr:DNA-binding protein [Deltaproteobacteria bacterium]
MACNILVDSCAYFRLAHSIHPLLNVEFGEEKHKLGVIQELQNEYDKSPTLQSKFYWVADPEYSANRKRCFSLTNEQKAAIHNAFYFMRDTAREEELGVSKVDLTALSYAYVLGIPIVTDDSDMITLAKEYEIVVFKSLTLLHLMYKAGHITKRKVREIASYWVYLNDTPKRYKEDYERLFNARAPL